MRSIQGQNIPIMVLFGSPLQYPKNSKDTLNFNLINVRRTLNITPFVLFKNRMFTKFDF